MFSVEEIVREKFGEKRPLVKKLLTWVLKKVLREKRFREFEKTYPALRGFNCLEEMLHFCDFQCEADASELENIPASGAALIVSNHPIGSLDGLALLKTVASVRPDVKIAANSVLSHIKPLEDLFIFVDNMSSQTKYGQIKKIQEHLRQGHALILFPAGEVSRLSPKGIRDGKWSCGFIRLAERMRATIVPVHIEGKNSILFYIISVIYKPASTYMLAREMLKQRGKKVRIRIGNRIPYEYYTGLKKSASRTGYRETAKYFRRHVYKIGGGKQGVIRGEKPIALPADKLTLKSAVNACEILGDTSDGKLILLYRRAEGEDFSPILHELGRLREISFRAVGEGSGRRLDLDCFDDHYYHIFLWDPKLLDIIGAYRFTPTARTKNTDSLYTHSLFSYTEAMLPILENGMELGRNFIQPVYWGKRGLDYLWLGLGAYLANNPECRYLFGPVSVSSALPPLARELMISFYRRYFTPKHPPAVSRNPCPVSQPQITAFFRGNDYQKDLQRLKSALNNMNVSIPTLYKQYSELCEEGGVYFSDFGTDPDFNNCIDGFVVADLNKLKPSRYQRYMEPYLKEKTTEIASLRSPVISLRT
jgi:putative hemolysin